MGEFQTLKRPSPSNRRRGEQGWLAITVLDDEVPRSSRGGARVPTEDRAEGFRRPARKTSTPPEPVAGPSGPASTCRSVAYRAGVAGWSTEYRELWGRRANLLEEAGLSWRDAEIRAFLDVWSLLQERGSPAEPPHSPVAAGFAG